MTRREFLGDRFYAFCQQEYDNARNFLKNCGKPEDENDRWLISQAKLSTKIFGNLITEI